MSEKKISLPRDTYCWEEVQGWRYYERNYKGSLTNESELTNQIYWYLMRYILAEINKMMNDAGLENIRFSKKAPYWVCIGYKK